MDVHPGLAVHNRASLQQQSGELLVMGLVHGSAKEWGAKTLHSAAGSLGARARTAAQLLRTSLTFGVGLVFAPASSSSVTVSTVDACLELTAEKSVLTACCNVVQSRHELELDLAAAQVQSSLT
jgi:hypothetical protein